MQPIILLHGAIGASDQLQPLADALKQRGFQPHLFDFSGHGNKPMHEAGFGMEVFVAELQQYILEHNLQQPAVFGYSMGGYVALTLAARAPQLVGRIATLATKFAWDPETAAKESKMLDPDTIREKVPKFAAALAQRHGASWEHLLQQTADMMRDLGNQPALSQDMLGQVQTPVLLGIGDRDNMVSLDETLQVFKTLPQSQLYMLPGTKHPIETMPIDNLNIILSSFLINKV
jgi:pimeloyl-ACP methyl ester carboxylesterase